MCKQRQGYCERIHFSKEQELSFAQYLVTMHLESKISANTISSYMVPEIVRHFRKDHGVSFPQDSIRGKYYALRDATKLYMSFKRRGIRMGWDSQNYTFMMDDPRWTELQWTRLWQILQKTKKLLYISHAGRCFSFTGYKWRLFF